MNRRRARWSLWRWAPTTSRSIFRRGRAVRGQRSRQLRGRRAEGPDPRVQPTSSTSTGYPPAGSARPTRSTPAQWIPCWQNFRTSCHVKQLHEPHTPLLTNLTGTWMTDGQATDPASWARQISSTIRFADELDAVLDRSGQGPRRSGPRRQPDRLGDAAPEVVERAPRAFGSCGTRFRTPTIGTPSCSGSVNCGRPMCRWTGRR